MQVKFGFLFYFPLDYVLEFCFLNRLVSLGAGELTLVVGVPPQCPDSVCLGGGQPACVCVCGKCVQRCSNLQPKSLLL